MHVTLHLRVLRIEHAHAVAGDFGGVAFFEEDDFARCADDRGHVGGDEVVALAEADLKNYAGLYLTGRGDGGLGLKAKLSPRLSAEALDKEPYLSPRIDNAKAPFLLVLSVRGARGGGAAGGAAGRIVVPWFAVGFVAVAGANSLHLLPGAWQAGLLALDNLLLATAMAALGLGTRWSAIRRAGGRPMVLATVLFGWLVAGGALVNGAIGDWWD